MGRSRATRAREPATLRRRIAAHDWSRIAHDLDERGYARLPGLLRPDECRRLARLYEEDRRFRKTVSLERHRFGAGEYRYLAYPLPPLVAELRRELYPRLAGVANAWQERIGEGERFPRTHAGFLARCREGGQQRPTPLLLRYRQAGFNCLHQDLYGEIAFPLQLTVALSRAGRDFEGGEFLLVEQRPRQQSRGEAVALREGEGILFPSWQRPVRGVRGFYRAGVRHGVSRIHRGERIALGVIFHDAR